MTVRAAALDDLSEVARIHKSRFRESEYLLSQYSESLVRAFYERFLDRGIFLVHATDQGIDGFVMGGEPATLAACRSEFARRNLLRCGLETLLRPKLWCVAVRSGWSIFFPSRKRPEVARLEAPMRLLSIAVAESAGGSGAAAELVAGFDAQVRRRHAAYELTVWKANPRAIRFYEKQGFVVADDTGHGWVLRKDLEPNRATSE